MNSNSYIKNLPRIEFNELKKISPSYKFILISCFASIILVSLTSKSPESLYQSKIYVSRSSGKNTSGCINIANKLKDDLYLNKHSLSDLPSYSNSLLDINGGTLIILNHKGDKIEAMDSLTNFIVSQCNKITSVDHNLILDKIHNLELISKSLDEILKNIKDVDIIIRTQSLKMQYIEMNFQAKEFLSNGFAESYIFERTVRTSSSNLLSIIAKSSLLLILVILFYIATKFIYMKKFKATP